MKKLFKILYVVILFFGIAGYPFSVDPAYRPITSTIDKNAIVGVHTAGGNNGWHVSEPILLVLLGSGLVGLSHIGRKRIKQ